MIRSRQHAPGSFISKALYRLIIGEHHDFSDFALLWNHRFISALCQKIYHLLFRSGFFPEIIRIYFSKTVHKNRLQASFFENLTSGSLYFCFAAFHVALRKAVCSALLLHDYEQVLTIPFDIYDSPA